MHLVPPKDQRYKVIITSTDESKPLEGNQKKYLPIIEEILIRAGCEWVDKNPNENYFLIPLVNSEIIRICNAFLGMAKRDEKKKPGPNIIPSNLKMEFIRDSLNEETIPLLNEEEVS